MEKLLAEELEDTESMNRSSGEISPRYRPCDHAALLLAKYWPERYQFDVRAPFPLRERQRLTCLNTWRKSRNLPPLPPLPERPRVANEESCKVAEVVFANPPLKIPIAIPFEKTKGRTVDAALFQEIEATFLAACEGKAPSGESGFVMEAIRENDGTGVTLVIEPAIRKGLNEIPRRDWALSFDAILGEEKKSFTTQWSLFTPENPRDQKEYNQRKSLFEHLANLHPDAPFRIRMELAPARRDVN